MKDAISQELNRQLALDSIVGEQLKGIISGMATRYDAQHSDRLLGLLLKFDFAASHIVTCDPWKRRCGGVPRGAFVVFRIDPRAVDPEDTLYSDRLILARVVDEAPTPVDTQTQQMLFQVHKLQAALDPLTFKDLQWSALKASIVGTYYDSSDEDGRYHVGFGNDVDTYFAPFAYVAFMPTSDDLAFLINAFVNPNFAVEIGVLRYTETPTPGNARPIGVMVDPRDIVGEPNTAQRLANFGKTRFGKSNSTKVIASAIFESGLDVAQVFFDPSGEYTYINDQDGTSLHALYHQWSVRYALSVKPLREDERKMGLEPPLPLAIDFYRFASVGHSLITALWDTENESTPLYWRPVLEWVPVDLSNSPPPSKQSEYNHYWRTMGLWWALLRRANFAAPEELTAPINFREPVKTALVQSLPAIRRKADGSFDERGQPISVLPEMYRHLWNLYQVHTNDNGWFPPSDDGSAYFNDAERQMLRMLGDSSIGGPSYIRPFAKYHNVRGSAIFDEIAKHIEDGRSVFIDMAQSNETVRNNLVDRICRAIYRTQNQRFVSEEGIGNRFVMIHFEEAHRLFRADDKDMNSIYNLLAKEGAKLNITMAYSTQSMTTISPDLIKNTDNFLIAHLDDDREIREVERKYVFRDIAQDLERTQSKGFVRMFSRSHRFALPVQIHRFGLAWVERLRQVRQSSGEV
jgi:hypothetical protein